MDLEKILMDVIIDTATTFIRVNVFDHFIINSVYWV